MDVLLTYILPLLYFILIGYALQKSSLITKHGLSIKFVALFYVAKVVTGTFYTYIMVHLIPRGDDIDLLFGGGLEIYNAFLNDPLAFPKYLAALFSIGDFNLGDTSSDFIRTVFDGIKFIHFLLDLLSGGKLYTNVLIFNGLCTYLYLRGWAYLRVWTGGFAFGGFVWVFPAAFFFTSVLLKEGIELCLIAAMMPLLSKSITQKVTFWRVLGIMVLFTGMFFFKYLIALTFLGMLVLIWVMCRWEKQKWRIAGIALLISITGFFGAVKLFPALDLPNYLVERRQEFQLLEANSSLRMKTLEPSFTGFVKALPEALNNVFFKPLPGQGGKIIYYIFSIELMLFWGFIVFLALKGSPQSLSKISPLAIGALFFALVNLLIIGYTITNIGAIIRYRSVFMPFIAWFFWEWFRGERVFKKQVECVKKWLVL